MWSKVDTCLIDIGNVLLKIDYFAMYLFWDNLSEQPELKKDFVKLIMDYEHGWMSSDEFILRAQTEFNAPETNTFLTIWKNMFSPDYILWQQIREWKTEGKRLVLFSNINDLHYKVVSEFPIFSEFNEGIFSFMIGTVKPEPAIYRHAIDHLGIDPSRCLYLDDLPENLVAGKEHGFLAHSFHARTAKADLERIKKELNQ